MDFASFIVIASFSWWLFFFILLPVGNQIEKDPVPGQSLGAPAKPNLKKKAIGATVLCLCFTGMYFAVIGSGYFSIEKLLGVKTWQEWEQERRHDTQ
jgi:predicted secreted protein